MCGIAGLLAPGRSGEELLAGATAMAATVAHRGPDDRGAWVDAERGVALGHARLSIVDLSPAGHQPMISASGRYVLTYNGEVYDHLEHREELTRRGVQFRGRSDTEVLLAAMDTWGIPETLRRVDAMFALGVWDREERTLWLARDRLGEKPLFYGWSGGVLTFGSELKALRVDRTFPADVDRGAVAQYLRYGYVPAPRTIHHGVSKVPPGSLVPVRPGAPPGAPEAWWDLAKLATAPRCDRSDEDAADELETALRRSVGRRLVADVPVGAFLSGGIDSSLVCAVATTVSPSPVRTFTVGFELAAYDESPHARRIAAHLGTEHTEVCLTTDDVLAVVPSLATMYDEPLADSSQLPTHLVSAVARRSVTVALSGDGGDELFGGYTRSLVPAAVWPRAKRVPVPLRRAAGRALGLVPRSAWDRAGSSRFAPARARQSRLGDKMAKLASAIGAPDLAALHRSGVAICPDPAPFVVGGVEPHGLLLDSVDWPPIDDLTELSLYLETLTYLPDDILAKVDRASMAVGLETRLPLLAPEVIDLAWSLPLRHKVRGGRQKWLLRHVLERHVPGTMLDRPKMGFGVPIGEWLRGPLRPWATSLLDEQAIRHEGVLDATAIRQAWDLHQSGRNLEHFLWAVLMYRAWSERWGT